MAAHETTEIDLTDLDQLDGEVLPERAVLSLLNLSVNLHILSNSSTTTYATPPSSMVVPGPGGTEVAYACQVTSSPGSPGLLGALGLGSANPSSSMTCMPAAIISHH